MKLPPFPSVIRFILLLLLLSCISSVQSQSSPFFYDRCAPSTCGNLTISFPFSSSETFCALPGYEVTCLPSSAPRLLLSGRFYQLKAIFRDDYFAVVSDADLIDALRAGNCDSVENWCLPGARFAPLEFPPWSGNSTNVSFFMCPRGRMLPPGFGDRVLNYSGCRGNSSLYFYPNISAYIDAPAAPCTPLAMPIQRTNLLRANLTVRGEFLRVLEDGFPLQMPLKLQPNLSICWRDCEGQGGRCGYNQSTEEIVCFCKDGCGRTDSSNQISWTAIVAIVVPISIAIITIPMLVKFRLRILSMLKSFCGSRMFQGNGANIDVFIKNYRQGLPTQYSYVDVKKMTSSFRDKLGGGGYGKVFKGKLPNGQLIAAKILEKSTEDGRDFVNEVATIGRIHHVNVIRLLGFCCDGLHRAIIYEFMPEGSLGDLLAKEESRERLGSERLLKIVAEIARGLEYLHYGCDTRILHLDIKPHNILLNHDLTPKISDFGLAKSYSHKDSIVSLTGARGTIGYIAPEIFMRNFGGVSHKSDVYSYGMLLLEMVLGRNKFIPETEQSSKTDFPNLIFDQLNQWRELELSSSEIEEFSLSRKMVLVALWCIQTEPNHRPSITEVMEMLSGRVEHIELPPKPLLFSSALDKSDHVITPADNARSDLHGSLEKTGEHGDQSDRLSVKLE